MTTPPCECGGGAGQKKQQEYHRHGNHHPQGRGGDARICSAKAGMASDLFLGMIIGGMLPARPSLVGARVHGVDFVRDSISSRYSSTDLLLVTTCDVDVSW